MRIFSLHHGLRHTESRSPEVPKSKTISLIGYLTSILALCCLFLALASCQEQRPAYKAKLDIDTEPYNLDFERYEDVLFRLDTAHFQQELKDIQAHYPVFLSGDLDNPDAVKYLKDFATDPFSIKLYEKVRTAFPDLKEVEPMVEDVLAHFHYYYPGIALPEKAFTCVSGISFDAPAVQIIDNQLVISLDWYLHDEAVYDAVGMPRYMSLRRHQATLAKDVAEQLYMNYLYEWRKQGQIVEEMVFYGRRDFFVEAMCPELPDSILLGYADPQWRWAVENEGQLWADIVGNRRLYDSGLETYMMFFGDGPYTQVYGADSPSRLGEFFGLNIIRSHAASQENFNLAELMGMQDLQGIFQQSNYKPRK